MDPLLHLLVQTQVQRRAFCSFEHQDEEAFLTVEWVLATGQSVAG